MRKQAIRLAILGLGLASSPALSQGARSINGGDPVAAEADALGMQQVDVLLGQAERAARQGRLALANELVERAEALVLTRSTLAGTETIPVRDGAVGTLSAARAALGRRDVPTATALMAQAARTPGM